MRGPDLLTAPTATIDLSSARPAATPRHRGRGLTIATAAGLTLLVVVAVLTRGTPPEHPGTGDPAAVLRAAAAAAERSVDAVPGHGEARLVTTRQYTLELTTDGEVTNLDQVVQEWIPADPRAVWMQRIQEAGPGRAAPTTEAHGRCGDYYPVPGTDPCDRPGLWQRLTPAFIAGLPGTPQTLLARLQADAAENGPDRGPETLIFAAQALEQGLLPARVRATVYRALALLPGLQILQSHRVLDGRTGVGVGLEVRGVRVEVVVDPATGAYLGRCHVLSAYQDGLPPGTVTDATSLRTRIVSAVGRTS